MRTDATEVLASSYEGKPLNNLNDVTLDGAGRIWFTNDTAGELGGVYRIDPGGQQLAFYPITDDLVTNAAFGGPGLRTL